MVLFLFNFIYFILYESGEGDRERGEYFGAREFPRESAEHGEMADDHEAEAGVVPRSGRTVERGEPTA